MKIMHSNSLAFVVCAWFAFALPSRVLAAEAADGDDGPPIVRGLPGVDARERVPELNENLPTPTHTLVDATGELLPHASVTVSVSDGDDDFSLQESISFESDEHGRISVPPLLTPESRAIVYLHHPEFGAGSYEVELHAREKQLRFPLARAGTEARKRALQGVVLGQDGRPVAGAVVHCRSVRTPGQGLINPVYPFGDAVTDEDGRFSYYLPNENRDRERGELIPVNSRYDVTITVPHDESAFPTAGEFTNLEPNTITLRHAARFHAFRFEAAGGEWIDDPEQLQRVTVVYQGDPSNNAARVTLERTAATKGRRLIPGKYSATGYFGRSSVNFEPVVVTPESPAHLEFRLPPEVTFRGRVVHGVTGEPLADAFVIGWASTSRQNLALLSIAEWNALRKLESNPSLDDPSIKLLQTHYGVQALVRTDEDGTFEVTQTPEEKFYGLMAFAEDYVPFKVRIFSLDTNSPDPVEAGDFALFPAAKVVVRPVHEEGHLAVSPKWILTDEGQPLWTDRFHAATDGQNREFEYVHWLRLNEPQPLYVPAGVRLKLEFETPYNDEWSPARVDEPIQLDQRAVHEVGDLHFAAALPAIVRVLDQNGRPVEGIPVRRKYDNGDAWCVAHNTDSTGQAYFHLNPMSQGRFWVSDLPGPREVRLEENLFANFAVADAAPENSFEITITEEQRRLLLESSTDRR